MTVIMQENMSPSAYHPFLEAKPNLGGQKFENVREQETALTRWLKTQNSS
jgi:hypothetical protein